MFHVRRRPADSQPRRRKKKPLGISNGSGNTMTEREGPVLIEITHAGDGGRRLKLTSEPVEVGSANTNALQLFGPSIQPRHCLISLHEGVCTVTPLHADGLTFVNGHHITQPTILHVSLFSVDFFTLFYFGLFTLAFVFFTWWNWWWTRRKVMLWRHRVGTFKWLLHISLTICYSYPFLLSF
jgi:FHA domain